MNRHVMRKPVCLDCSWPHVPGDRWFVDETYLDAIHQFGQVIDVLVSPKRDLVGDKAAVYSHPQ